MGEEIGSDLPFSYSEIKGIMDSSKETGEKPSTAAVYIMEKATQMFVNQFTKDAYNTVQRGNTLNYKDLARFVEKEKKYKFLSVFVPEKIKYKYVKEILEISDSSSESEDEELNP